MNTAAALASGAVPVTTLRAAVIVGRGSAALETIVALIERLPLMVAPRWLSTPTQPVALDDVIRYLDGVAGRADALTPVRAGVARPLIEGLRNPTAVDDERIGRPLPFPLTSFCDAPRHALDPAAGARLAAR